MSDRDEKPQPWHRKSRTWKVMREFMWLATGLACLIVVLAYREEASNVMGVAPAVFGAFMGFASVFSFGNHIVQRQERKPDFQRAMAEREGNP